MNPSALARPFRFFSAQSAQARQAFRIPSLRMLLLAYFGYCAVRKSSRVAVLVFAFDTGGARGASMVAVAQLVPAALIAPLGSAIAERAHPIRALWWGYTVQCRA